VDSTQLAAIGAFLSGAGSVISAIWYVRRVRRQADKDCDRRLAAFKEGLELGRRDAPN
jgi:hypothetical protein